MKPARSKTPVRSTLLGGIAATVLAGVLVYAQYHPSDSVAVERGDALWFCVFCLLVLIVTAFAERLGARDPKQNASSSRLSLVLDLVPWLLGGWIMIAAFGRSNIGNLRLGTNEAWVWISAAAIFYAARRLFAHSMWVRASVTLLLGCAIAQGVHGLHQYFISLPQMRIAYQVNPEQMLQLAGIDAPPGSSERMVFENRLRDGGPTGTFALANSLAGVLVMGGMIALAGLWFRWSSMSVAQRVGWIGLTATLLASLIATGSRSAIVAGFLGAAFLLLSSVDLGRHRRTVIGALMAIGLLGGGVLGGVLTWGNREWFEQAPASLAFRLQYWRSTIAMVKEMPLFGAGPGNYQMIYEQFREPSANEQIAEPHNFFFETLASGGWIAAALLVVLSGAVGVCWVRQRRLLAENEPSENLQAPEINDGVHATDGSLRERGVNPGWFVWFGAGLSFLLVWAIGFLSWSIPDLEANLFSIPLSVAAMVLAWSSLSGMNDRELHWLGAAALVAMMIHLTIAGGWTVPGVAIGVWLISAVICRNVAVRERETLKPGFETRVQGDLDREPSSAGQISGNENRSGDENRSTKWNAVMPVLAVVLLGGIVLVSILPVSRQQGLLSAIGNTRGRADFASLDRLLGQAMAADPWSTEAARWRTDVYRWQIVRAAEDNANPENAALRETWHALVEQTKRRGGEDPSLYRELGTGQLHVYQRFGQPNDLQDALQTFTEAARWSPSNQWMAAQLAEVAKAAGDAELATTMAKRAEWLAGLGFNMGRMLDNQMILEARPLGIRVATEPQRRPASELLMNQSPLTDVP